MHHLQRCCCWLLLTLSLAPTGCHRMLGFSAVVPALDAQGVPALDARVEASRDVDRSTDRGPADPKDGSSTSDSGGPFVASGGRESLITVGQTKWRLHEFTVDGVFTITGSDGKKALEYLIVGGGSGALTNSKYYPAGGGGGDVQMGTLLAPVGVHRVTVGQGGDNDQDGTSSSVFGIVAPGGSAVSNGPGGGGASGSGFLGGLSEGHSGSGGGGGAGGPGGNADWGNTYKEYYFWGGKGGVGVKSDITGTMLGYGGGGSGQGWHFVTNQVVSKNGGPDIPGDYQALGVDGGVTALHTPDPLGGICPDRYVSGVGEAARPYSGGGGGDFLPPSGASGVVIIRYPIHQRP